MGFSTGCGSFYAYNNINNINAQLNHGLGSSVSMQWKGRLLWGSAQVGGLASVEVSGGALLYG